MMHKFSEAMGETSALWDDSPGLNYATDRPGWEGVSGLIVKYASLLYPEFEEPKFVPPQEEVHGLPATQEAAKEGGPFRAIAIPRMWIPGRFEAIHAVDWVEGGTMPIGSVGHLNAAIDQVCALWGKDRASFRDMPTDQPDADAPLDEAALHGLAVYSRLAEDARERRLPLILDF
ncbi:hypothetical protein EON82_02810 [bacterium]|nr:MAG: hypothetical protein EON82_02810 [bacterium]